MSILCKSITHGKLMLYTYEPNKMLYVWPEYGRELYLEESIVEKIFLKHKEFLLKPYILVEDNNIVKKFELNDIFDNLNEQNSQDNIIKTISSEATIYDIKEIIDKVKMANQTSIVYLITSRENLNHLAKLAPINCNKWMGIDVVISNKIRDYDISINEIIITSNMLTLDINKDIFGKFIIA